jgi:nicotinamide-nucleotide amidase
MAAVRPGAVLLTIGDELLLGDRVDTNGGWLAAFLSAAGFRVQMILTVGDDVPAMHSALSRAVEVAAGGVVVMTGGLGPTTDDVTREAVASWLGVPLQEDPAILETLEARFRQRGFANLPLPNRRLAQVPEGAEVLPNPAGTAPGLALSLAGRGPAGGWLFLLPGVPVEMRALMEQEVGPRLARLPGPRPAPLASAVVRTAGIPESALAEMLEPLTGGTPGILVQYRPSWEGVELRITASDGPDALEGFMSRAAHILEPWQYGGAESSLAGAVLARCEAMGWTIAVAESCTGGLLGARLTAVPGSARVFLGGVVAYANDVKVGLLGVEETTLAAHGAVSEIVARQMAEGVRARLGATVGVSITGVAGPGGGSPHRPVGTVCFGLADTDQGWVSEQVHFPGGRDEIRERAVQHALRLIDQGARKRIRG